MSTIKIGDSEYRVECNFNAIMAYMRSHGLKDITFLSEELSVYDWADLMVCSINEGERLDGNRHDYTVEDLCACSMAEMTGVIGDFIRIFSEQNTAAPSESKKK